MISVGIEALNVFGGTASIDVSLLARHRGIDQARFENLLMHEKTVALPQEDAVTFAVNAAAPLLAQLDAEQKDRIELLITCSESGIDFGKSISTYVHHHLQLSRNCRMFELKQACYATTAGLQMAVGHIIAQYSPGAKALVVGTDISRFLLAEGEPDWAFAEPSAGAGAVALLVSDDPRLMTLDSGASGIYGYEVMDMCRPVPDSEAGDADLSLLSYLDCCQQAYEAYCSKVADVDYGETFQYLAFHTPFGGMVKGAHRTMMRKLKRADGAAIEADFERRIAPGLSFCRRVGNIMGGTLYLALAGLLQEADFDEPKRIGCFSYGSGCCSEFFSGVADAKSQQLVREMEIGRQLDRRFVFDIETYQDLFEQSARVRFGTRDVMLAPEASAVIAATSEMGPRLYLSRIENYHRKYTWIS